MESIFLPVSVSNNVILNADSQTVRRKLSLIQGEEYEIFLKFLNGSEAVTPDISDFSFVIRDGVGGNDVLSSTALSEGSGAYPYKFSLSASSLALSARLAGCGSKDFKGQIVWTEGEDIEIIEPLTVSIVATASNGTFPYVASVNGATGALTVTGAGSIVVSQAGTSFTISGGGGGGDTAELEADVASLIAQTGGYYPRNNPSGFLTGVDLSAYATNANLNSTGANLSASIASLAAATGSYYPKSNPSGYLSSLPTDVVRTTGNQSISGNKNFLGSIYGNAILSNTTGISIYLSEGTMNDAAGGGSLDWVFRRLYDGNGGATSIDWNTRQLLINSVTPALDWNNKVAYDNDAQSSLNWASRTLVDAGTTVALDWSERSLKNDAGNATVNWNNSKLLGSDGSTEKVNWLDGLIQNDVGTIVVDWHSQLLKDNSQVNSLDWQNRQLYDAGLNNSLDWENRKLLGADGSTEKINWGAGLLKDASALNSVHWENRQLMDVAETTSVDWGSRVLNDSDGINTVDWQSRALVGGWVADDISTDVFKVGQANGTGVDTIQYGVVTLAGGTATVTNALTDGNSLIFVTVQSLGTVSTPQAIAVTNQSPGVSFDIVSADPTDTSVVAWQLVKLYV